MRPFLAVAILLFSMVPIVGSCQETTSPVPKKNPPVMPTSRLAAAKTAYLKNTGGNSIPFNVISTSMEGWIRFALVDSPDKADIIIEVSAPTGGGGVSVSSKSGSPTRTGEQESSTTTTRELGTGPVRMTVIDGKSKSVLWTASEQPKFAMRKKAQEDNLVEAAERLFTKFHDRVEPELAK